MRDWAATLRKASFRGVSFLVDVDQFDGGKRIARHEYAGGVNYYLEEMGQAIPAINVTAYLLGDDSDAAALSLQRACLAAGPGRLVLPIDSGRLARIENFSRVREKDRRGYIAFGFSAIPEPGLTGGVLGLGDIRAILTGGLSSAFPGLSSAYRQIDDVISVASWMYSVGSLVVSDAIDLARLVDLTLGSGVDSVAAFFAGGLEASRIIGESVLAPSAFEGIKPARFDSQQATDLHAVLDAIVSATAAPQVAWISRPQARAARQIVQAKGEKALSVLSTLGPAYVDLYVAVSRLVETAVRIVSDRAADAVPVVRVDTGISLPSTVLAYQLYGDAQRAEGMVDIARVGTPMLMPVSFEALES